MKHILLIASLFLLVGCSGRPSEQDIKHLVFDMVQDDSTVEIFEIDDFKVAYIADQEDRSFVAKVSYDVVFIKNLKEIAQIVAQANKEADHDPAMDAYKAFGIDASDPGTIELSILLNMGNIKKGDRFSVVGLATVVQSDHGWQLLKWEPE